MAGRRSRSTATFERRPTGELAFAIRSRDYTDRVCGCSWELRWRMQ